MLISADFLMLLTAAWTVAALGLATGVVAIVRGRPDPRCPICRACGEDLRPALDRHDASCPGCDRRLSWSSTGCVRRRPAVGRLIPRGAYEVHVDLERRASARSFTSGAIRRRTTVRRSFELVPPGAPLATTAPDPALVAAVREAYREAIVAHRRREGRADVLRILAIDRSFGDVVPVHPAILRVDVLVGDVRVGTDLVVLGPRPLPYDGRPRGELDPGELPDPLPETVTIELRPAPAFIDDVGLRAPVIAGDTIRIEDVPLFSNPGPRWLPD